MEWLFVDDNAAAGGVVRWLAAVLPHCAWSCHVVVADTDRHGAVLDTVVDYLAEEEVATIYLHLVAKDRLPSTSTFAGLLEASARFQTEAYRERTGARLVPLPILEVPPGADPGPALHTAGELAARLAKPSLLLWDDPDDAVTDDAVRLGLRLYLGSRERDTDVLEILTAAHILDSTLERADGTGSLLGPCRPHNVIADGKVFACARQRILGLPDTGLDPGTPPSWRPDSSLCAGCIADTIAGMGPSLAANRRRIEGRELALRASVALVDDGAHDAAAEVAHTAIELSRSRPERADGLIQEGLCRLAAGRLDAADQALIAAADSGADPGLIAYHRARVQVAWRDDIEALELFAEAIELGTEAASATDLHFEMALSHIRLEEWADARIHLDQAGGPTPEISFNLGVCDVNDGRAARALEHLDHALDLGPAEVDLGRIRFFRGFCLKELERFEEAAEDLRLSIELEEPELAHHNLLGFCLFKLGRHAEAVASFERAVAADPTSAVDWANIGVNLERLGETRRAEEMYRKALGMDGSIGFAREGLDRVGG